MKNLDFVDVVLAVGFIGSLVALVFAGQLGITADALVVIKDIAIGAMSAFVGKKVPQVIGS